MTVVRAFGDAATDRGLHLGDGLFETVLVAAGRACFLAEHVTRLRSSCAALGVPRPAALAAVVSEVLPEMWTEENCPPRAALRISVTRGPWAGLPADPNAEPSLFLVLRTISAPSDRALDAVVLDAPRIDPASPLAGHKTLSWMAHVEARRRAFAAGAHVALLRTIDGDIAEADAANLFVVVGDDVVTPPLDRGILPGITRARVIATSNEDTGGAVVERRITAADLGNASEAFVTSSLAGLVPVRSIDGRALPGPGTVAARLAVRVPPDDAGR